MTNSDTIRQIVVTDSDIKDLARWIFSQEVQGSRLDLTAYDTDLSRQKIWAVQAEARVSEEIARLRATGEVIDFQRVESTESIPFVVNPVIPSVKEQAAELFQDVNYDWTGALFVKEFKGEENGEFEDVEFLYFQGRNPAGDVVWMDANGMDELSQTEVDAFLNEQAA